MCWFQLVKVFFAKIQKFWGAPMETSIFLQICAHFDRIWHEHAGLRPACEDRANTRKTCEQKTLKKQVVRNSCENARNVRNVRKSVRKKNLEKAGRAKIVQKRAKRAKIRAKKTIVRTVRAFHPNSLFVEISPKKSPILPQNLHIQISDRISHGFAQKT